MYGDSMARGWRHGLSKLSRDSGRHDKYALLQCRCVADEIQMDMICFWKREKVEQSRRKEHEKFV